MMMKLPRLVAAFFLFAATCAASAQDFSWSAYGTVGYARSNRDYHYLRHIDKEGTFATDTLLGAQGDVRFTPQWSATVQLKLAQSLKADDSWSLTPAWAFLAWRPADDWLVRAGKMRVPAYLYSESMQNGVTYDMARLPVEMYGLVPSTDFVGLSAAKTWNIGARELTAEAYHGSIDTTVRAWLRDGAPPFSEAGANFLGVRVTSTGLVLSLRSPEGLLRAGFHQTRLKPKNGMRFPSYYPFVQIAPGVGYYQVNDALPGPGVPGTEHIHNTVYTLGVDHEILPGWRVAAEFERTIQRDTQVGIDGRGGYVALFHSIGRFTPYASWARMKSSEGVLDWNYRLQNTLLPPIVPGAAQINAAMRVASEYGYAIDQTTLALGTSFSIDAHQKLKAEWAVTRIGRASRFVDVAPGTQSPRNTSIGVFSINYNFSF